MGKNSSELFYRFIVSAASFAAYTLARLISHDASLAAALYNS